jgi:hypothetical protein
MSMKSLELVDAMQDFYTAKGVGLEDGGEEALNQASAGGVDNNIVIFTYRLSSIAISAAVTRPLLTNALSPRLLVTATMCLVVSHMAR